MPTSQPPAPATPPTPFGSADAQDAGLRARLVDVGVDLVTREGVQALSLREIARRAGVSHGAPRRYFPTHLELLSAIARRGFADLAARTAEALGDDGGREAADRAAARAQLCTLARVYLDFALTRRGMYELMFRHDLLESNQLGLRETSLPLFDVLVGLIGRARPQPDEERGAEAAVVAGALWSNLHGIAQLWGWGSLPLATGTDDVEPLLRAALDAHLGPEAATR
ncbi:TetR/AcrR family transcriptional regulator [Streptomyces gilvosporeus]|uniref:TetR family transcriptional regulator n=1 Tax=Streptomyces gilvosporeus TaxID=553510 RepID=A0A1V0TV39_9ACTN|nr:TetR/AcrR family transcriptional regulator [Streptomyces gilvosporeus]ARF56816.1 TetR family transcriptional regulator [Streptomyces gilvosporeus]